MAATERLNLPDGKFLYYTKYPAVSGIWRMPASGGEETLVVAGVEPESWGYWAVVERASTTLTPLQCRQLPFSTSRADK
jgi:hypothetical protein